ncbi:MAG: UpxY family transcription antiterminator [Bacteroidaceae bacterium]|nr:UpxY family transcription antiterminator [Bacteroidaceae bacterium]
MELEENSLKNSVREYAWFAMSATFGRELKAKDFLEKEDVECFIPMKYEIIKDRKQGKTRKLVPAIHNLLFVHTTKERIQALKTGLSYLQYLTKPLDGRNIPIIVPDNQMQQFITVCNTYDDKLVYLAPDEINIEKGTPVKIVGSAFDGVEGIFVTVNKRRKKQVVVQVQGIAAVMIAKFTDGYLQVLY